jgi:hypothetical protein
VLRSSPVRRKIVTDQLGSYPAAKAEIPELVGVKHMFVKAAAQLNNRAENSRQPTRERKRRIPQGDFLRGGKLTMPSKPICRVCEPSSSLTTSSSYTSR